MLCRESARITFSVVITEPANPDGVNTFVQRKHPFCKQVANAGDTDTCNFAASNILFSFNWPCNEFELLKKSIEGRVDEIHTDFDDKISVAKLKRCYHSTKSKLLLHHLTAKTKMDSLNAIDKQLS